MILRLAAQRMSCPEEGHFGPAARVRSQRNRLRDDVQVTGMRPARAPTLDEPYATALRGLPWAQIQPLDRSRHG